MKKSLFIGLIILGILSLVAAIWRPHPEQGGKSRLVWVSDNNPARTQQIDTFNTKFPDRFVTLDYNNGGAEKIILQCSSGVGPDIFDVSGNQLGMFVEAGVLWDITDKAKEMGFSAETDSWPSTIDEISYFGRQYAYPCNAGANILIYNKNVFDYFGVPYPQGILTWEEFVELTGKVDSGIAKKVPESGPIYGVTGMTWYIFFESRRGEYFNENGALQIKDNKDLLAGLQWHKDIMFKYHLQPTSLEMHGMSAQGGWGAGALNQFASNRYAMIVSGNWSLLAFGRTYNQQIDDLKEKGIDPESIQNPLERPLRLGCVLIPKFSDHPPSYRASCRSAGINALSPNKEQALVFLQYLAGPEYSQLINENSDYLPGNPKYADVGNIIGQESLSAPQMHEATKEAVSYGYVPRRSPFLLSNDVARVLGDQISRMESDPSLDVQSLLDTAQAELELLIRRNLDRSPELRKLYEQRFGPSDRLLQK